MSNETNGNGQEKIQLTREEQLESQNLHLKAQLLTKDIEGILMQLQKKQNELGKIHEELEAFRLQLESKYKIDLLKNILSTEGEILPRELVQQQGG